MFSPFRKTMSTVRRRLKYGLPWYVHKSLYTNSSPVQRKRCKKSFLCLLRLSPSRLTLWKPNLWMRRISTPRVCTLLWNEWLAVTRFCSYSTPEARVIDEGQYIRGTSEVIVVCMFWVFKTFKNIWCGDNWWLPWMIAKWEFKISIWINNDERKFCYVVRDWSWRKWFF